jgi:hypothetical protein
MRNFEIVEFLYCFSCCAFNVTIGKVVTLNFFTSFLWKIFIGSWLLFCTALYIIIASTITIKIVGRVITVEKSRKEAKN